MQYFLKKIKNKTMKQTAVEYLIEHLKEMYHLTEKTLYEFEQSNKMFEEHIMDAWEDGKDSFSTRSAKQYYKETFGK